MPKKLKVQENYETQIDAFSSSHDFFSRMLRVLEFRGANPSFGSSLQTRLRGERNAWTCSDKESNTREIIGL